MAELVEAELFGIPIPDDDAEEISVEELMGAAPCICERELAEFGFRILRGQCNAGTHRDHSSYTMR